MAQASLVTHISHPALYFFVDQRAMQGSVDPAFFKDVWSTPPPAGSRPWWPHPESSCFICQFPHECTLVSFVASVFGVKVFLALQDVCSSVQVPSSWFLESAKERRNSAQHKLPGNRALHCQTAHPVRVSFVWFAHWVTRRRFQVIWGGLSDLGSSEPNRCKPNQSTYRQWKPLWRPIDCRCATWKWSGLGHCVTFPVNSTSSVTPHRVTCAETPCTRNTRLQQQLVFTLGLAHRCNAAWCISDRLIPQLNEVTG